jgi:PAS domain S-box-containing protein
LEGFRGELNSQREADRVTINRYSPPGVLVNGELQILQFRGPTGLYLEPPNGKASFDVLKMARQGLMLPLRAVINKAKKDNKTARRENVRVGENGATRMVNIEVIPLKNLRERHFLILFEDAERSASAIDPPTGKRTGASAKAPRSAGKAEYASLERELAEMRDYLQSVLEQHDAANEELQASNEEVQSANEELQSINEELETSKEELESANEELTTVNEEMGNRNTELNRLNSDLMNLQTSAKLAILLLGRDLTIRRFSAQAEKEFNLLPTDLGKSIERVRHGLDLVDLAQWIEDVIAKLHESEREVRDKDGRWYLLRARPYITVDNKVDGAVLVLVNIDELKRTERMVRESEEKYRTLVAQVTDYAIFRMDLTGRPTTWNEGVKRILGFDKDEFVGKDIVPAIFTPEDVHQGVADRELRRAAAEGGASDDRWLRRKDGTHFFAAGITSALTDETGRVVGYTKIFRDTTEQRKAEEALRQAHIDLRARAEELARFNRIAVGREVRMIELKKEINELREQRGEPARYPLEFEQKVENADG